MKKNIGTADRILRLILAIIMLLFAWWQSSWIVLLLALFVLYEVFSGWCLFYQIIGKNSCPIDQDKHQ